MAKRRASCHDAPPMKSRLCYAWFGDEDVRRVFSSLENKSSSEGPGETGGKVTPGHEGHCREIRPEPPRTQSLYKTP
jgi:hypothetical protein